LKRGFNVLGGARSVKVGCRPEDRNGPGALPGAWRDRKAGKQRLYGLDAGGLRPVHEWTGGFERFWNESFDRLDTYVQDLKQTQQEE
jgi:hypothetical protein